VGFLPLLVQRRISRGRLGLAVCAALALGCALPWGAAAQGPQRPNFVVIQVDDQANNTFNPDIMPNTFSWIVDGGTRFENGLAAPPLCCPDRAGVLTGQYPHNNGVFSNEPGYPALLDKHSTLPVWLHRAGYRTALIGKFLNHYADFAGATPAPGFDHWFAFDAHPGYYNYGVSDDGHHLQFGHARKDYSTHVFTAAARSFIGDAAGGRRPFFMWLAYNSPHDSPGAGEMGKRRVHCPPLAPSPPGHPALVPFTHLPLPEDPSFNEADVSDKPPWVSGLTPIDENRTARLTLRYQCTAATMNATDRDIGKLRKELADTGELSKTIVIYLSDNGYYFGEHRLTRGKVLPYEPGLQVPFAVRVPPALRDGAQPGTSVATVSNTDVAPTLLDFAGDPAPCNRAGNCRVLDGRSMRPLLGGPGTFPEDRGVLAEINTQFNGGPFAYEAIRTPDRLYADYGGSNRELYNLDSDPFELDNLAGSPGFVGEQVGLASRLAALAGCSGTVGPTACE
jgi:N-acetylglucosamine-6-sulfatase